MAIYVVDTVEQTEITKANFLNKILAPKTQKEGLTFGKIVSIPEFNPDKVLTKKQLEKRQEIYTSKVGEVIQDMDRYSFNAIKLGIVAYEKRVPTVINVSCEFTKPSKSKVNGFIVAVNGDFRIRGVRCSTLSEARNLAKKLYVKYSTIIKIAKVYENKNRNIVGFHTIGYVTSEVVGELKSKPTTQRKSYMVVPRYAYVVQFTLPEVEYDEGYWD